MPYVIVSTEDVHIMPDTEHHELSGNRLRTFDSEFEPHVETGLFNFDNVATVQEVTEEELDELMEMLN